MDLYGTFDLIGYSILNCYFFLFTVEKKSSETNDSNPADFQKAKELLNTGKYSPLICPSCFIFFCAMHWYENTFLLSQYLKNLIMLSSFYWKL